LCYRTRFKKKVFIKTPPEQVFRAWATAEHIRQWFIAKADNIGPDGRPRQAAELVQPGDQYFWQWHQDLNASGTILEVVENQRLKFTFGDKTPDSEEQILVTVTLSASEDGGETLLELTQENMADTPAAQVGWHLGCNLGWSFFITNLKGWLEHGIDLRETDPDRAYAARAISH